MGLLDIKAVYDYWTNVGNQGAYQAINGGAWDAIAGNSQAVGAAAMSSFIDFFALRTFQENVEKAGYYSAQEGCEGEALKYGGLALGQAGLEVFGGSVFAKFGK